MRLVCDNFLAKQLPNVIKKSLLNLVILYDDLSHFMSNNTCGVVFVLLLVMKFWLKVSCFVR